MKNYLTIRIVAALLLVQLTHLAPSASAAKKKAASPEANIAARGKGVAANLSQEEQAAHEARITWWREAKLGLFIH